MERKVMVLISVEKRGLFGVKKTVMEMHTVEMDGKTYRKLQKEREDRPYSIDEMILYDKIFDE